MLIQECPHCHDRSFDISAALFADCGGWIECENCSFPLGATSKQDVNNVAVNVAIDELKAKNVLEHKVSDFFGFIQKRRDELLIEWNKNFIDAICAYK